MTDAPLPPDPIAALAGCRDAIEDLDRRIIALIAERTAIGRRTTALKRAAGLPILDPQREAAVIRRAVDMARTEGLDGEVIREIFWRVVGISRRAQTGEP